MSRLIAIKMHDLLKTTQNVMFCLRSIGWWPLKFGTGAWGDSLAHTEPCIKITIIRKSEVQTSIQCHRSKTEHREIHKRTQQDNSKTYF